MSTIEMVKFFVLPSVVVPMCVVLAEYYGLPEPYIPALAAGLMVMLIVLPFHRRTRNVRATLFLTGGICGLALLAYLHVAYGMKTEWVAVVLGLSYFFGGLYIFGRKMRKKETKISDSAKPPLSISNTK